MTRCIPEIIFAVNDALERLVLDGRLSVEELDKICSIIRLHFMDITPVARLSPERADKIIARLRSDLLSS